MHATPAERKAIQVYVEDQLLEEVVYLEKVAAELIDRARYDIWDVLCTDGRWWVITNPVNLYSQADFKRHVALDFHLGLTLRTSCSPGLEVMRQEPEPGALLPGSWRRWKKALEVYHSCGDVGDFQAVGSQLWECLLSLVGEAANDGPPFATAEPPRPSNDRTWPNLRGRAVAGGEPGRHLSSRHATLSVGTWEYVNWLMHAKNAKRIDAEVGLREVYRLLGIFGCVSDQG